jgi:glucan phosphoethanolaminetransferase (alkaline phosphatase superfamily)
VETSRASNVFWTSTLALGPVGWLQVLSFAFFGLILIIFALGLHRAVASSGRPPWAAQALLVVGGVALMFAAFKTEPHLMQGPQTWHGTIHFLAFLLLVLSFFLSLFFWWRRLRGDLRWRAYAPYTLITTILYIALLFASTWQRGFYLFMANVLTGFYTNALMPVMSRPTMRL